jgi:hypothetical protein
VGGSKEDFGIAFNFVMFHKGVMGDPSKVTKFESSLHLAKLYAQGVQPHILASETLKGAIKEPPYLFTKSRTNNLMLTPHFITSERTICNSSILRNFLILTRRLPQSTFS